MYSWQKVRTDECKVIKAGRVFMYSTARSFSHNEAHRLVKCKSSNYNIGALAQRVAVYAEGVN